MIKLTPALVIAEARRYFDAVEVEQFRNAIRMAGISETGLMPTFTQLGRYESELLAEASVLQPHGLADVTMKKGEIYSTFTPYRAITKIRLTDSADQTRLDVRSDGIETWYVAHTPDNRDQLRRFSVALRGKIRQAVAHDPGEQQ